MNNDEPRTLRYLKLHPKVADLALATQESACFDLRAFFHPNLKKIDGFNADSTSISSPISTIEWKKADSPRAVVINPGERMMVPTGIIFDIPKGYSVRIHARSGLALKAGLVMGNAEGIIDSDYTDETKIIVLNISNIPIRINHGDRIAQAEMVPVLNYNLVPTTEDIAQKTNRAGGFGSTGVS
jgi:dUTP pyrophosphatase